MVKTTVKIEGMMCGHCEAHVNEAVKKNFKVKSVSSSHDDAVSIIISDEKPDEEKLMAVIEEAGYKAVSVTNESYTPEKKSLFSKLKK